VRPGKCYRGLYTEKFMVEKMEAATPPDTMRTNLTFFILTLKALGVHVICAFDLMNLLSSVVDALLHGLESLYTLGGLDDQTNLADLGTKMSSFSTEPRASRIEALDTAGCLWEVLGVVSALQVKALFVQPRSQRQQLDYDSDMIETADRSGDKQLPQIGDRIPANKR
jgi:HrpA-like RNA helicase